MSIGDWSSDLCSSDLGGDRPDQAMLDFGRKLGVAHDRLVELVEPAAAGDHQRHGVGGDACVRITDEIEQILLGAVVGARILLPETMLLDTADENGAELRVAQHLGALEHGLRDRSEENTSELPSLMRISYAVFCLNEKIRRMEICIS